MLKSGLQPLTRSTADWLLRRISCRGFPERARCLLEVNCLPVDVEQPSVVIIGGGMAGLSAAEHLANSGITNFKVLEATNRIGGRMRSAVLEDAVVELGAECIWGASPLNPVFKAALEEGLVPRPSTNNQGTFFTGEGRPVDGTLAVELQSKFADVLTKAARLFERPDESRRRTLAAYLDEVLDVNSLGDDAGRVVRGLMAGLRAKMGEELSEVSPGSFGSLRELPGGEVRLSGSMDELAAALAARLPPDSVVLSKPVRSVTWSPIERARVECIDGTDLEADYVLATLPLGVLEAEAATMFRPQLPRHKMAAARKLRSGHVDKIYLAYEEVDFWRRKGGAIRFAWSAMELESEETGWLKGFAEFVCIPGSRKVMGATIAGREEVEAMESCQDREVAEHVTRMLRRFTGDPEIPHPIEVVRSRWTRHPYTRGAFTCLGLEATLGDVEILGEPVPDDGVLSENGHPPVILFAGEHTHPAEYSTLQGARKSGIREADRIVDFTLRFQGPPPKEPP